MRVLRVLLCALVLATPVALVGAAETSSADRYSVTVSPVRLELSADPGQSIETTIVVRNVSNSPVDLKTETMDFVASDQPGTPAFVTNGVSPWSMSPWVKTDPTTVTLVPSQQETVTATIQVPDDAEPGGHYAAVFFASVPNPQSGQTGVVAKVGTLLLLTVSGKIERSGTAALSCPWLIAEGPLRMQVGFTNTGNVHVKPEGRIDITTLRGKQVAQVDVGGDTVLPGSSRAFQATWQDPPDFGIFRVQARLDYGGDSAAVSNRRTVLVAPWPYILATIAVFLIGITLGLFMRRRSRPSGAEEPEPTSRE